MPEALAPAAKPPAACTGAAFLGLVFGVSLANGQAPAKPDLGQSLAVTSTASRPLDLLLTREELRTFIRNYEDRTGQILTTPISDEEILVTAPGMQAPMRDVSQDVMGGIAAPFWAIAHPTQSWRILVPIPPKGERIDERPAPDPR